MSASGPGPGAAAPEASPRTGAGAPRPRLALLALAGVVLTLAVASWAWRAPPPERIAPFLAEWGAAFAAYLVALHVARRGLPRRALIAALGLALAWRLVLVLGPPLLSDDIHRYVWEGRIQAHGGNPYRYVHRPEAERWEPLRDEVWEKVNHKGLAAIYPPLFQLLARASVAVSDSVTSLKLLSLAGELVAIAALGVSLSARGLPLSRLLILAWSPLAILEIAGSGHNDALGLACVAAALAALDCGKRSLAGAAVGAGVAVKLLPGLIAAAWLRRFRARDVALAVLVVGLTALPYIDAGRGMFTSLDRYSRFWRFNETLFAPLADVLLDHQGAVRAGAVAALLLALGLGIARVEAALAGLVVVGAWLLLGPNVLPWYALWLLPFLVLRLEPGTLLFTGTVALAYFVYPDWQSGEPWELGWGMRALEYAPCLLVGLLGRLRDAGEAA